MAAIQTAPKSRMLNSEFLNFCTLIINYMTAMNPSQSKYKNELDLLINGQKQFNNSLNKISKTAYWTKAKILKAKIHKSRSGFMSLVYGEISSEDIPTKEAAAIVYPLMKKYTKMGRMKYNDLLKFLLTLVTECESDGYKTEIETLNLTKRVTALRTLYNEAMKLEGDLIDDEGLNKRLRKSTITRIELCNAYDKLVKRLNALAIIEGDEEYLELFAWWNALIDRYRNVISSRMGAGKGGKTDDGEGSQHDPDSGSEPEPGGGGDHPVID